MAPVIGRLSNFLLLYSLRSISGIPINRGGGLENFLKINNQRAGIVLGGLNNRRNVYFN